MYECISHMQLTSLVARSLFISVLDAVVVADVAVATAFSDESAAVATVASAVESASADDPDPDESPLLIDSNLFFTKNFASFEINSSDQSLIQ